jgi:hypothetical protein
MIPPSLSVFPQAQREPQQKITLPLNHKPQLGQSVQTEQRRWTLLSFKTHQLLLQGRSPPLPFCALLILLRAGLAAPRAGGGGGGGAPARSTRPSKQVEEDDDFGDTDVASLLD